MNRHAILLPLVLVFALAAGGLASLNAAGQTYAVYGADTSQAQRDAIAQAVGVHSPTSTDTVTTEEIAAAVQRSGLTVDPDASSLASAVVTCLNPGQGLTVSTQNITRLTPPVYIGALLAAGVQDDGVAVAAPADSPVAGDTALVAVLKAVTRCQAGKPLDPARVDLAYKQIAWSLTLAGPTGNVGLASDVLLKVEAPVVAGEAQSSTAIGAMLNSAASSAGLTVDASLRPTLLAFLSAFQHRDFGPYTKGFSIQNVSQTESRLTAGTSAPAGTYNGVVQHASQPLTVAINGQDVVAVVPAPNVTVTRNGRASSLNALHQGDRVTVTTNPDGTAQHIAASPATGFNWSKLLVVLLLILAAIFLIAAFAGKGHEDGFVLEPKSRGDPS